MISHSVFPSLAKRGQGRFFIEINHKIPLSSQRIRRGGSSLSERVVDFFKGGDLKGAIFLNEIEIGHSKLQTDKQDIAFYPPLE
jgi:hypothetical protein